MGWGVIAHIDSLQEDADFWVRWIDRLHPDERGAIARGEIGVVKRPFSPDWIVGEWMEVASNLWLKPQAPRYTHRGWRIAFDLRDFRARLPRRTPGMYEPPELDHLGYPIAHDKEAIDAATEDGNYTPAHALAVPEIDEEPDELAQRRIRQKARKVERETIGDLLVTLEDLRSAVKERLEMNPDAVRIMGRDAWALRTKIDSVERRLKRRHAA